MSSRSSEEFEQTQRGSCTDSDGFARALDGANFRGKPAVDQRLGLVDQRRLERDAGHLLDPQHDVLEGQPGIGFGQLLRRDLEAGLGQQLGLDAGGDDFGIDEHAVAIEDDKIDHGNWVRIPGGARDVG